MKILLIHNKYLHGGGEDEVVKAEKFMMESRGHQVILFEKSNHEINQLSFWRKIRFATSDIYKNLSVSSELTQLIKAHEPDLAHIHNPFYVISPSVYEACRRLGVPVVQTLHNFRFLCPVGIFYRNEELCFDCLKIGRKACFINRCWNQSWLQSYAIANLIDYYYDSKILRECVSQFIALSSFSFDFFVANGFDPSRLNIKTNFVSENLCLDARMGENIVFVGSFQPYKGISTLLKAWELLPAKNKSLKLLGDGPLFASLRSQYQSDSRVQFLGQCDRKTVIEEIKSARCLVLPSECYENFPRVIIEAFACGAPVVVSDLANLSQVVEKGRTGLVFKAKSADELADALNQMLCNDLLVSQIRQEVRNEFLKKYTMEYNYGILMEIYKKACS